MTEKFQFQEKVPEFVKEFWGGALDALTKTEKDVRGFINQMIDRGKLTPEEGKKILAELVSKFNENREKIESKANESVAKTLHMINLPTKQEVKVLEKKIGTLSRKVNKLKKEIAA